MGLVLDTCILIHAERHGALDFSPWASHGDAFISAITVSELLVGVHRADSDARRYRIAPLTLQLLIENCVKHNRMSDQEPLVVSLTIADEYLSVVNPVRPRSELASSSSTGIGLANIRRRYELLTTRPVVVQSDTHFTVNIPLL